MLRGNTTAVKALFALVCMPLFEHGAPSPLTSRRLAEWLRLAADEIGACVLARAAPRAAHLAAEQRRRRKHHDHALASLPPRSGAGAAGRTIAPGRGRGPCARTANVPLTELGWRQGCSAPRAPAAEPPRRLESPGCRRLRPFRSPRVPPPERRAELPRLDAGALCARTTPAAHQYLGPGQRRATAETPENPFWRNRKKTARSGKKKLDFSPRQFPRGLPRSLHFRT
jgi:hypothetical protein